jgi:N-methylhydantoinase B
MDHGRFGPQGALGGGDGAVNKVVILRGEERYVPQHLSKEQDISMAPGDMVWVRTPGGGGYGDPFRRPPQAVFKDVRLGRVSIEQARKFYGVIVEVTSEGKLSLDVIASEQERKSYL